MGLKARKKDLKEWTELSKKIKKLSKVVTIGIVGKYFNFKSCRDTYISVIESINHAAWAHNRKAKILWLDSEKYEKDQDLLKELNDVDGIIVPGGFGKRGTEGMILAAEYARKNKIPYFGLCLGMQILTISFARYVLGLEDANSTELNPKTKNPVICTMADQVEKIKNKQYGGSMRLGTYSATLSKDSLSYKAYGVDKISERHRHRYEFNNKYRKDFEKNGLRIAGINEELNLVEIAEVKDHPWMLGPQFHPEFKSRPLKPHSLFREFIKAAIKK
jgi:CTP synthase